MDNPIFINLSNHPSKRWSKKQRKAAEQYGKIVDIPFPNVPATATEEEIRLLCESTVQRVLEYQPSAVMCQGEFTLAFQLINRLLDEKIIVVAACSERKVKETGNKKESYFLFSKFRRFDK